MATNQNMHLAIESHQFSLPNEQHLNAQLKDSQHSTIERGKRQNSIHLMNEDHKDENAIKKKSLGRQVSFDSAIQNEFISGFEENKKNILIFSINDQINVFQSYDRVKEDKHTLIENLQQGSQKSVEIDNENSFLLGTQTYKEICIEENSKKVQLVGVLESQNNLANGKNKCEIHDSGFQIVCIEDKELICPHCAIFGDHKGHSLAPLKQVQKFIDLKRQQVNNIISNYKSLQLGVKQKAFMNEFSQRIRTKKDDTLNQVAKAFVKIKQFLSNYQNKLMTEIQKLHKKLQDKISESIKKISLNSNRQTFQKWQNDASKIVQQLELVQLSKANQIRLFLDNFKIPIQISNEIQSRQSLQMVSLEEEGKRYLNEMEEELNLNINQVMKISSHFKFSLQNEYRQKIKQLMLFEADCHLEELMEENNLDVLLEQLRIDKNNVVGSQRNSFCQFDSKNSTNKSIALNIKEKQLSSTTNSMNHSMPFFNMTKKNRVSSPQNHRKHQPLVQNQPLMAPTQNLPLKFKKKQHCLQQSRKLQMSVRSVDQHFNSIASKPNCHQHLTLRPTSPCMRSSCKSQNQHLFVSNATARLNRCSSREPANIYSPFNQKQPQKIKTQTSETNEPLKAVQHFENTETQTFDLTNCQLMDTEIIYFVQKASKIRKIKHLKLGNNQLTNSGLQKILNYLPNCNLLNLSNNKLSQNTIDLLLRKRQRIMQLRMLNLSNNKLNERKIKQKISEFKKMGIVVTL